jgi:hypothetical protein
MNITKLFLIFALLLQILFFMGYVYSNKLLTFFSFSFIFDEEFVIMFAMFLVLFLCFFFFFESFKMLFDERITILNKFFLDNFEQVLLNLNNLIMILNKLLNYLQFNLMVLKILIENLIVVWIELEKKYNNNFLNYVKFFIYRDNFLINFLYFINK